MLKRISLAFRVLLGLPIQGQRIDGTLYLDGAKASEGDHTQTPPFDLLWTGAVRNAPPVSVLREDRFRVGIFRAVQDCPDCGKPTFWLVLELRGERGWEHVLSLHESRLLIMLSVLQDAAAAMLAERERPEGTPGTEAPARAIDFTHLGRPVRVSVHADRYQFGGGLAVELIDESDGMPYAMLSVNVPGTALAEDEFIFKTYSENEGLLEAMLDKGVVELTGKSTDLGPICRLLSAKPEGQVVAERP